MTNNGAAKKQMGELFATTVAREEKIRAAGFEITSIWEDEWAVANTLASMQSSKQYGDSHEAAATLCNIKAS